MPMDQIDVLGDRIVALQRELKELQRDVARNQGNSVWAKGWRAWIAIPVLCVVVSHTLVGMFWSYPFVRAVHLEGSTLRVRDINFEDRDNRDFGGINADAATLDMRHHDGKSEVSLNPDGLRLENADNDTVSIVAPYTIADGTKGVRIQGYVASDSSTGGSLFLALPDGKAHTKPRLMLLDVYGRPVE